MKTDALRKQLEEQIEFITRAIDSARNDDIRNITPLDHNVDEICTAISRLDEKDAAEFEAPMAEMIGKLEELAIELRAFQERMEKTGK